MKKLKVQAAILFFLLIFSRAYAYDNHDFQVWNTDGQEFKPNKFFKITTEEEFRWGNNASEFYYQHYDIGYAYLFNKYFNFGGGLRYAPGENAGVEVFPYLVPCLPAVAGILQ